MKFISALKHTALTLGVLTGLGLAAACDGDGAPLSLEPGDYEGVGAFIADDFDDEERGFVYLQVTVNDDGTVDGTGNVYQPGYYDESVPEEDDSFVVTGTVTADGVSLSFEGDVTAEGTVSDGVVSASFSGTTEEAGDLEGQLVLVPSWGTETGITCGEFDTSADFDGFVAFLLGEDGDFAGVFLSNPDWGNSGFAGVTTGTFEAGVSECSTTCGGDAEGTLTGELDGESAEFDLEAEADFYPESDPTQVYFYDGYISNDDIEGGFNSDRDYCTDGEYD